MAVSPPPRPDHVLTGKSPYPETSIRTPPLASRSTRGCCAKWSINLEFYRLAWSTMFPSAETAAKARQRWSDIPPLFFFLRGNYSYGVDGDYFPAMGFSLLEGRFLTAAVSRRADWVCVVSPSRAMPGPAAARSASVSSWVPKKPATPMHSTRSSASSPAVKQVGLTEARAQGAIYYPYALRTDTPNLFVSLCLNRWGWNCKQSRLGKIRA